jgi:DNA polymerase lambda
MKKEYLALTEHYASFAKKMSKEAEKEEAAARAREQVKAGSRSLRSATRAPPLRLGGKVFDGLRFCIPLEIGPPAKQKNKWEIVCAHLQMSRTLKADTQAGRRSHHQTRYGHDARHMGQDVRVHAGTATGLVHA